MFANVADKAKEAVLQEIKEQLDVQIQAALKPALAQITTTVDNQVKGMDAFVDKSITTTKTMIVQGISDVESSICPADAPTGPCPMFQALCCPTESGAVRDALNLMSEKLEAKLVGVVEDTEKSLRAKVDELKTSLETFVTSEVDKIVNGVVETALKNVV